MDLCFLLVCVVVCIIPTNGFYRHRVTSYDPSLADRHHSNNDRFYDYNGRNVERGISGAQWDECYNLCYDAQWRGGSRAWAQGCMCSRYDIPGIGFGGRLDQRRYSTACNCPVGTVCVGTDGRRRCVMSVHGQAIGYHPGGHSVPIGYSPGGGHVQSHLGSLPSFHPQKSGLLDRIGGHCGILSSLCRASRTVRTPHRDLNPGYINRFTFNHQLGRCVMERVRSSCSPRGIQNNLFVSLRNCNRICL